jgi:hypothetical protein
MTSANPLDENTLEQLTKVFPKKEKVNVSGTSLSRWVTDNS